MRLQAKVTEPQARFLQSTDRFPAFVAGFGAGKSECMALAARADAAHAADALIGLYAPTYDLVRLITAPRIMAKLDEAGIPHRLNKQDGVVYTSWPRYGDFLLRTMEVPERLIGYETYRSHVDELDTLPTAKASKVWKQIMARNRQKPAGIAAPFNRISAYTTPEGFRFVYDRWVRNAGPGYAIYRASTRSNPFLPSDYVDTLLDNYPAELIAAYVEGDFVNLTTGTVYRSYKREACRSAEAIRGNEPLHLGVDFNVQKMATVVNVERHGAQEGWHVVAELSGMADTPHLIETVKAKYEGHAVYVYPDASGGSRKTVNASLSDIALLRQAGFIVRTRDSNPAVKDRILSMNAAFSKGRLWVNDKAAPRFAEAMEQQAYDANGEPDKTAGHDHFADAEGYFVHYTMPVQKPTFTSRELRL